jgi:hypothetical protein
MRVQSVAFSLAITLCLALAAAGLAYVGGRAAANPEGRYEAGVREGEHLGRAQARTDYAPGTDAYRAIFDEGRTRGRTEGRAQGRRDGARTARTSARDDVFDGFPGGWEIGSWYLVNIRPGDDGARYGIGARLEVKPRSWYGLCRGVHVCRRSR